MNNMNYNINNNLLNNNMNPMINNMNSNPFKMEIIMHLMNQNAYMQNQIEMNNQLIFKLFQDCFQIQNFNNVFQNNNQILNWQNFCNMQNNLNNNNLINNKNDFVEDSERTISICFEISTGYRIVIHTPKNIKISWIIIKFMEKANLNTNLIDEKIFFIFNGSLIKKNDKRNLSELGISSAVKITVVFSGNILGK